MRSRPLSRYGRIRTAPAVQPPADPPGCRMKGPSRSAVRRDPRLSRERPRQRKRSGRSRSGPVPRDFDAATRSGAEDARLDPGRRPQAARLDRLRIRAEGLPGFFDELAGGSLHPLRGALCDGRLRIPTSPRYATRDGYHPAQLDTSARAQRSPLIRYRYTLLELEPCNRSTSRCGRHERDSILGSPRPTRTS